jgi:SAM-dependent methyltransferase
MSDLLDSITTLPMCARLQVLRSQDPELEATLRIVGAAKEIEWMHVLGPGRDPELRSLLPPIPPQELRRITSSPGEPLFLWQGARDVRFLVELYERYASHRPVKPVVLDFGCGCGRLTRFLSASPDFAVCAAEANPDHVAWCTANLPNVTTRLNGLLPPLPFDNGTVDFAYAWSVFSHTPRERAHAWFTELARVLAPNGLLIVTTLGLVAVGTLTWSVPHRALFGFDETAARNLLSRVLAESYVFLPCDPVTLQMANVGTDYGNAFIDMERESSLWSHAFELVSFLPGGVAKVWQDALVLRKK